MFEIYEGILEPDCTSFPLGPLGHFEGKLKQVL